MIRVKIDTGEKVSLKHGSWKWVASSLSSVVIGVVAYFIVADIMGIGYDTSKASGNILTWMPFAMAILAASFILSIVATFKVQRFMKIVTILLSLVAAAVFMLAWFAYALSKPIYG